MSHSKKVCAHGTLVSQCRCPGPKNTTIVPCPPHCQKQGTAVLIINRTDSQCGACQRGADPYEKAHITRLGYAAANAPEGSPERKGCGAVFTEVGSHYRGNGMEEAVKRMRPDLPWTEKFG